MKSIKTRLMLWLMAWITTILGTTGLYFYIHDYNIDQNDFQTQRAAVQSRLSLSLPHGIWQLDDENVRLALDSELSWPSVIAINVKGKAASTWAAPATPTAICATCCPTSSQGRRHPQHPHHLPGQGTPGHRHRLPVARRAARARRPAPDHHLRPDHPAGRPDLLHHVVQPAALHLPAAVKLQLALNTAIRAPDASGAQITHLADDEIGGIVNGFNRIVARTAADLVKRTAAEAVAREEKERRNRPTAN